MNSVSYMSIKVFTCPSYESPWIEDSESLALRFVHAGISQLVLDHDGIWVLLKHPEALALFEALVYCRDKAVIATLVALVHVPYDVCSRLPHRIQTHCEFSVSTLELLQAWVRIQLVCGSKLCLFLCLVYILNRSKIFCT